MMEQFQLINVGRLDGSFIEEMTPFERKKMYEMLEEVHKARNEAMESGTRK